jgi:phenylalanyl-tRNA synthetase beta chain
MLFNIDWLKDYVDFDMTPQQLADMLTLIGHEVEEIHQNGDFSVLEVNISPNRSDCMSYIGLAREIAAAVNGELKLPDTGYSAIQEKSGDNLKIVIETPQKIHRFAGKVIKNVKIGSSPEWMKKRLESVGLRPVSDMVDITNYVLLETGHPMHAYDMKLLAGSKLGAREAKSGEKMTTLDGNERILQSGDIVITDAGKIVGLGGVMGGANTEISEKTTEIALEAAWFDPIQIRKTSKRLAISTDASFRFERTADIEGPIFAIDRCCALISEIMKADILSETIDEYPKNHEERQISFRPERARKLIAVDFTDEILVNIFEKLHFKIQGSFQYRWKIQVPSYRNDIQKEVDLIEEAARLFGYDKVPANLPPFRNGADALTIAQKLEKRISTALVRSGLNQVINYSFVDLWENELFETGEKHSVKILNPIAEDMGYLRASIIPRLLSTAALNINYSVQDVALFEIGNVFIKQNGDGEIRERKKLGIVLGGRDYPLHWQRKRTDISFYHLKGIIESLPYIVRLPEIKFVRGKHSFLDSEQNAEIIIGDRIAGSFGRTSASVLDKYNIKLPVFVAEIDLDTLVSIDKPVFDFSTISRFQSVERDIAIIIDENISSFDLLSCIKNLKLDVLKKTTLFDVYLGGRVPQGKKSVALNLVFLSNSGSFTSEEINSLEEQALKALENRFSAVRIAR